MKILSEKPLIRAYCCDCMDLMAGKGDGEYSLAVVDPPYGIKMDGGVTYQRPSRPNSYGAPPKHKKKAWDSVMPQGNYFRELHRTCGNQVIFGGNYFTKYLPASMGWVYWAKMEDASDFSDGELIFTSFQRALKSYRVHQFHGTRGGKDRIHPTQKPIRLYLYLLTNYAKPGDTILDTHGGSFSSAIACWKMGFNLDICEMDEEYFEAACSRFERETRQGSMFG